jgi:hypothetical protein
LPEGVDFWDFDCRTGKGSGTAGELHVSGLTGAIDTAANEGWEAIYIEILAKPGRRSARPKDQDTVASGAEPGGDADAPTGEV